MKITLIFPGIVGIGWDSFGKYPLHPEASLIHHGLCSLSACLKREGHAVDLIDLRRLRGWRHFRKEVQARDSELWGITITSPDYELAMRCVDLVKEQGGVVVVGGVHPTVALESVKDNPRIDYIVQGEGEISLPQLARRLEKGEPGPRVIRGEGPDLDALPFIDRQLFDVRPEMTNSFYLDLLGLDPPLVTLVAGRGCRYNCSFCQPAERKLFGSRVRRRSVENVIRELGLLRERYAFGSLMIHDDCLLEDKEWVVRFCQAYRAGGFQQPFYCQGRADLVCRDEDTIALLAQTGLRVMSIGFESGSDRILKLLRKGVTVEQNRRAAQICQRHGIRVFGNYMLGLPTETPQEMMDTARLVRGSAPFFLNVGFYAPSPGSDLYDYCRERNLLLADNPQGYHRNRVAGKVKGVDYAAAQRAIDHALGASLPQRLLRRAAAHQGLRHLARPLRSLGASRRAITALRRYLNNW